MANHSPETTVKHMENALRACEVLRKERPNIRDDIPQFRIEGASEINYPSEGAAKRNLVGALKNELSTQFGGVFFCGKQCKEYPSDHPHSFEGRVIVPDDLQKLASAIQQTVGRDETDVVIASGTDDNPRETIDCRTDQFLTFTSGAKEEDEIVLTYSDVQEVSGYVRGNNAKLLEDYWGQIDQQLQVAEDLLKRIFHGREDLYRWLTSWGRYNLDVYNEQARIVLSHIQLLLVSGTTLIAETNTQQVLDNSHPQKEEPLADVQLAGLFQEEQGTLRYSVGTVIEQARRDLAAMRRSIPGIG